MFKLIQLRRENLGDEGARNLAAALTEMPQLLVLDVRLL